MTLILNRKQINKKYINILGARIHKIIHYERRILYTKLKT